MSAPMAAKALLEFEVGHPLKAVVTRPNYNAQGKHVPNAQGNWTGNHFAKLAADKHGYFVKKLRSISVFDSARSEARSSDETRDSHALEASGDLVVQGEDPSERVGTLASATGSVESHGAFADWEHFLPLEPTSTTGSSAAPSLLTNPAPEAMVPTAEDQQGPTGETPARDGGAGTRTVVSPEDTQLDEGRPAVGSLDTTEKEPTGGTKRSAPKSNQAENGSRKKASSDCNHSHAGMQRVELKASCAKGYCLHELLCVYCEQPFDKRGKFEPVLRCGSAFCGHAIHETCYWKSSINVVVGRSSRRKHR